MISPVMPTYARAPLIVDRGEGPWLFDTEGTRYLDFGAGVAVNALGHAHPDLVEALTEQARRIWHASNLYRIPGQEELASLLCAHSFADTVFFTNSGAEAMEGCIKTARKYFSHKGQPERHRIITFEGAFHGRTLGTISAAGSEKLVKGFGPLLPGFDHVRFGDHDGLKAAIGPQTAAILIEPIQGEGGIRVVPPQCLRGLRELCDEHGLLLIFDEIQCGMGRTGRLFAHEWAGITPDIMASAKGIGGGFPLGAFMATEEAASGMTAGTHGSTYGGNPLAMAVGLAMMKAVLAEGFMDHVPRIGGLMRQKLEGLVATHPTVLRAVRGEGLMLGLECVVPCADLVATARDHHLLVVPAADNVVRLIPPLNIASDHVETALSALDTACSVIEKKVQAA
ncbi:MAG: aspartate aminotransferase family protein [Neomegalonema sp.]|nr:aspartate aminotransferase family protein [Neomegalonema sp.]